MKKEPFVIERTYDAPVENVWKAISDKNEMKKWYFDLPDFKAEPGAKFEFYGGKENCTQYKHLCEVVDVIPNKKLSYTWRYEGLAGNSKVTFELFPEANKTKLKLTHEGLETFPQDNEDFARESFKGGWTYFVDEALKGYLDPVKSV